MLDSSLGTRMYAHFGLFSGALLNTGTTEQARKFRERITTGSGGFAMTELGYVSVLFGWLFVCVWVGSCRVSRGRVFERCSSKITNSWMNGFDLI